MPRDPDGIISIKWAGTGDRLSPESQSMDRRTGWTALFDPGGTRFPLRQLFNQIWSELSALGIEVNERGILEWDARVNYVLHARVMGSDGHIYRSVVPTGPASGNVVNPVVRANDLVWLRDLPDPPPAASDSVAGISRFATLAETIAGNLDTVGVTPSTLASALPNLSADVPSATDTQQGTVELASLSEALAGLDGTRAVTPAGVRAHGDARYVRGSIPSWRNTSNYGAGILVRGSDLNLYESVVATGPATGNVVNPITRSNDLVWRLWPAGLATTARVGLARYGTDVENDGGVLQTVAVTPRGLQRRVDGLNTALAGKAAGDHNHSGVYSALGHDHGTTYALRSHGHSYASTGHSHSQYATTSALTSGLAGKSNTGHTHSQYLTSLPAHSHTGYVTGASLSVGYTTISESGVDIRLVSSVSLSVTQV